jgi:hypothetical protein
MQLELNFYPNPYYDGSLNQLPSTVDPEQFRFSETIVFEDADPSDSSTWRRWDTKQPDEVGINWKEELDRIIKEQQDLFLLEKEKEKDMITEQQFGTTSNQLTSYARLSNRTTEQIYTEALEYLEARKMTRPVYKDGIAYTKGPIYIAGPMSGYDEHNFPLFNFVAKMLRDRGWYVLNPAENFNGDATETYETHYAADVKLVMLSDTVIFLPGWEKSGGAVGEYMLADRLNKQLLKLETNYNPAPPDPDGCCTGLIFNTVPLLTDTVEFTPFERNRVSKYERAEYKKLVDDNQIAKQVGELEIFSFEPLKNLKKEIPAEETVLQEADRLVAVDRQSQYGHPFDDFSRTAALWHSVGMHFYDDKTEVYRPAKAEDVAITMMLLKISRIVNLPKRDSIVDAAGYAKTLDLVIKRRKELEDRDNEDLKRFQSGIAEQRKLLGDNK